MATIHAVPVGDLIAHEAPTEAGHTGGWLCIEELPADQLSDCPCGTTLEPVEGPDGSIGWLITHSALDGRELAERRTARNGRPRNDE